MEKVSPATTILPVRARPALAATLYAMLPVPDPLAVTTVSQASVVLAVQGHAGALAMMVNEPELASQTTAVSGASSGSFTIMASEVDRRELARGRSHVV